MPEEINEEESDWFKKAHPEAKDEFPEILIPREGKVYVLTFKEEEPRNVKDNYGTTAVIEVEYNGKLRSLFLGHTYLAQQILAIQKEHDDSLLDVKISLKRLKKEKQYIEYEVRDVTR